jgi:hypothetical protein
MTARRLPPPPTELDALIGGEPPAEAKTDKIPTTI